MGTQEFSTPIITDASNPELYHVRPLLEDLTTQAGKLHDQGLACAKRVIDTAYNFFTRDAQSLSSATDPYPPSLEDGPLLRLIPVKDVVGVSRAFIEAHGMKPETVDKTAVKDTLEKSALGHAVSTDQSDKKSKKQMKRLVADTAERMERELAKQNEQAKSQKLQAALEKIYQLLPLNTLILKKWKPVDDPRSYLLAEMFCQRVFDQIKAHYLSAIYKTSEVPLYHTDNGNPAGMTYYLDALQFVTEAPFSKDDAKGVNMIWTGERGINDPRNDALENLIIGLSVTRNDNFAIFPTLINTEKRYQKKIKPKTVELRNGIKVIRYEVPTKYPDVFLAYDYQIVRQHTPKGLKEAPFNNLYGASLVFRKR